MHESASDAQARIRVSAIAALTADRAIGTGNDLVVKIADDLKRFRALTRGHAVVMGRKTHDSIGRLLPDRPNIIVSRDPGLRIEGAIVCHSIEEALARARELEAASANPDKEAFVIGGAEIFRLAMPFTDRLYLTLVDTSLSGDVFFPEYEGEFKKVVRREDRTDDATGLKYSWIDLER